LSILLDCLRGDVIRLGVEYETVVNENSTGVAPPPTQRHLDFFTSGFSVPDPTMQTTSDAQPEEFILQFVVYEQSLTTTAVFDTNGVSFVMSSGVRHD
jgi:hypothetical protein